MKRFRRRALSGAALLLAFIPVTLAFIPAGALCWILGIAFMGLAMRGLDELYDGPRSRISSANRTGIQFVTLAATALLALGSIIGLLRIQAASPWARQRILSQIQQIGGP